MSIKTLHVEIAKLGGTSKVGGTTIRKYTGENGMYAWLNLAQDSIKDILDYFPELKLEADDLLDLHCTVMYSPEAVPFAAINENKKMPDAQFIQAVRVVELKWWSGHDDDGYLVALLNPDNLQNLHDKWKAVGAKPTFEDYTPHITLKTGLPDTKGLRNLISLKNKDLQQRMLQVTLLQEQIEDLSK